MANLHADRIDTPYSLAGGRYDSALADPTPSTPAGDYSSTLYCTLYCTLYSSSLAVPTT